MPDRLAMHWHAYANDTQQASDLADAVAADLRTALDQRGHALIALSGGNTPRRFMQELARRELDWPRVTVTLVDERWVPAEHSRSNAGLVRDNLLQGLASQARLVSLYAPAPTPESGMAQVRARIDALLLPLDVAVLGMGEDGHTASFFPGGDRLREALDPAGSVRVLPMRAPSAGEPRVTLSLPVLANARRLYLLIQGNDKRRVLNDAAQDTERPIGAVFDAAPGIETYWCP